MFVAVSVYVWWAFVPIWPILLLLFFFFLLMVIVVSFYFLFLALLGLGRCTWALSNCGEWEPLFVVAQGLLMVVAPHCGAPAAGLRLQQSQHMSSRARSQ